MNQKIITTIFLQIVRLLLLHCTILLCLSPVPQKILDTTAPKENTNTRNINICEEKDNHDPKVWYKQVRPFLRPPEEFQWNSTLDFDHLRVYVNPEHGLVIKNYTPSLDEGLYKCYGMNGEEDENKFNYLIDMMNASERETEIGDAKGWQTYYQMYLAPINKDLDETLEAVGTSSIGAVTHLKAITEWEPWGRCVACGSPEGQRRRRGKCRLRATKLDIAPLPSKDRGDTIVRRQTNSDVLIADIKTSPNITEEDANGENEIRPSDEVKLPVQEMFRKTPIYSCRSVNILRLEGIPPHITDMLREVPDFIQVEKCQGVCIKANERGAPSKLQFPPVSDGAPSSIAGKRKDADEEEMSEVVEREAEREEDEDSGAAAAAEGGGFRLVELQHGQQLRLVCPGASASSVVTWKKDGQFLGVSGGQDASGPVDALGTLLIGAVSAGDAGNYACAVDGAESAVVGVSIELPPMLKTAEFLRHNVYLGVVMGICLFAYCSGVVVAFTQRHRFQPPGYSKVNTTEEGGAGSGL